MATRAIHTVFTVGGENTYQAAVKRINAALKELNSEMELSKEKFAGQEDSYTALYTKQQQLQRMIEKQNELAQIYASRLKQVQDSTDALNGYSEELRDTLNQIQAALHNTAENSVGYDELAGEAKEAEEELRKVETQMGKNATKSLELETGINKAHTEMERLSRELADIDPLVDEAASSMDGLAYSMEETAGEAEKLRDRGTEALEALASAEIMDRAKDGFREVASLMQECIDKYVEFESAIAGVEKTVDATDAEMEALTKGIRDLALEIPASTTEIASVAEAAGQLGIATEDILDFTEVMIKLGTSTNMSATEAADALARLSNITDMDPSDYERLGSVIVDLGNKTATTETEIVEMATRLAATGDLVGLSVPQILAMSAALSSLGIEAEAGGTAAAKLFKKLETAVQGYGPALEAVERTGMELRELELLESNQSSVFKETADSIGLTSTELGKYIDNIKLLGQVSDISGTTAEDFVKAWGTDAVSALDLFITGLGDMEASGGNAVNALNEIAGFTEVRLSNAILALASSGGILSETMDIAASAWEDNSALAEEAAKRYETTESKVTLLKNAVGNLEVALGEDFMAAAEPVIEGLTGIAAGAASAAEESPALASALAGVGGALGGLAGLATVAGGIQLINSALGIFGTMAGPVGIGVAALAGLASAVTVYQANVKELSEEAEELIDANDALLAEIDKTEVEFEASGIASATKMDAVRTMTGRIEELSEKVNKTDADKAILRNYVSELNELLPGLGASFDEVTGSVDTSTESIMKFAEKIQDLARLEALQGYMGELTGQQVDLEIQMRLTEDQIEKTTEKLDAANRQMEINAGGVSSLGRSTNTANQAYRDAAEAAGDAERELESLRKQQAEMAAALEDVNGRLDEARTEYDRYMNALGETSRYASESQEVIGKLYDDMVTEAQTAYDEQVLAAQTAAQEQLEAYTDGLDAQIEALDDTHKAQTRALEKQQKEELRAYKKQQEEMQDALEEALDAEMDALEAQYDEKKKLIDAEYTERLKLIDEDRYNAILEIDEQIAALEALTEAEEKALEEQKQAEEIAEAERAVREAETREEKEKAEKELADLLEEIERDRLLAEREAQIAAWEEEKKQIEEEAKKKEEAIEAEKKAALEAVEAEYKEEKKLLEAQHKEKRELLKQQLSDELYDYQQAQSDKMTALKDAQAKEREEMTAHRNELVAGEKKRLEEEAALLAQAAEDKLTATEQSAEDMLKVWEGYRTKLIGLLNIDTEAEAAGKSAGSNFAWGIELGISDAEEDVTFAAKRLARGALLQGMQEELDMHSPSRKARQMGNWFGEGMVLGLEDKVSAVRAAVSKMASAMDVSGEVSSFGMEARTILRRNGGAQASGAGTSEETSGDTVNNWYVTVDAKNVQEFNDIVRLAQSERQGIRMGYVGG